MLNTEHLQTAHLGMHHPCGLTGTLKNTVGVPCLNVCGSMRMRAKVYIFTGPIHSACCGDLLFLMSISRSVIL